MFLGLDSIISEPLLSLRAYTYKQPTIAIIWWNISEYLYMWKYWLILFMKLPIFALSTMLFSRSILTETWENLNSLVLEILVICNERSVTGKKHGDWCYECKVLSSRLYHRHSRTQLGRRRRHMKPPERCWRRRSWTSCRGEDQAPIFWMIGSSQVTTWMRWDLRLRSRILKMVERNYIFFILEQVLIEKLYFYI